MMRGTSTDESAGLSSDTVPGGSGTVVNERYCQSLVPPAFSARTRQSYVIDRLNPDTDRNLADRTERDA